MGEIHRERSVQSRRSSAVESFVNISVGLALAVITQRIVFPWYGIEARVSQNISIAIIFTIVSFVRSYTIRRIFNGKT